MKQHLEPRFGSLRLDEIGPGAINAFGASLLSREHSLTEKRINNILAVGGCRRIVVHARRAVACSDASW
jgi:hypothetical protein